MAEDQARSSSPEGGSASKQDDRDTYQILEVIPLKDGGQRSIALCHRTGAFNVLGKDASRRTVTIGPDVSHEDVLHLAREICAGSSYHKTRPGGTRELAIAVLALNSALKSVPHSVSESCVSSRDGGACPVPTGASPSPSQQEKSDAGD